MPISLYAAPKTKEVPENKTPTFLSCKLIGAVLDGQISWHVDVKLDFSDGSYFAKLYAMVPVNGTSVKEQDKAQEKAWKYCREWQKEVNKEIEEREKESLTKTGKSNKSK